MALARVDIPALLEAMVARGFAKRDLMALIGDARPHDPRVNIPVEIVTIAGFLRGIPRLCRLVANHDGAGLDLPRIEAELRAAAAAGRVPIVVACPHGIAIATLIQTPDLS